MPASSTDLISSALRTALSKKGNTGQCATRSNLEDQLNASSKQIFLHDVEYEYSSAPQSFVLSQLKSKYVTIISKRKENNFKGKPNSKMAHGRSEDKLDEPRVTLWSPDKVILGWRKIFPPGAGMINLGNTCYMNSSLQALFHIPSLANWLLEEINTHIPNCESNSQNASFCSICAMMRTLKLALDRGNNVIKPTFIHNKLKSIGKTLLYGRQEDAHEFIKLLLDHMEKSFLQFKRATKLDHRSKETTPLNQIFGGYLRQQVICPLCCYVSTTFSHFQDLVLDIRSVGSVDEALNLYFKKETLDSDNAYKCEKCHKRVPATKRHLIEKAPHVLLLQLKRFTISGGKITKHVNIQKTIDISRYVNGVKSSQANGAGPYFYRLVSMVIHIGGSQHGGHYTAVAEASNNSMFEFDDASVRPISVHSALLRNPYILFYEMVHKTKSVTGPKQVIRQSSEKALLRQSSTDKISKPLPTSLSASCMWNGVSSATDAIGEGVNRNGLQNPNNKKSPLLSQRERERVSFGIKLHSTPKNQESGKLIKSSMVGMHNGASSKTYLHNNLGSSSSSTFTPKNNHSHNSSLVPYNDDSDDSEDNRDATKMMNGHSTKLQENGHVKVHGASNSKGRESCNGNGTYTDGIKSSKVEKNLGDSNKINKLADKTKSAKESDHNNVNKSKVSNNLNPGKSNKGNEEGSSSSGSFASKMNGKSPAQFLPRSVQVQMAANGKESGSSSKVNGCAKLINGSSPLKREEKDGKIHVKEAQSAHLNGSSQYKQDNGWIVTENNERSPSESSTCSSTSSHGFSVTEKHKHKIKHAEKILKERDSFNGWVVTVKNAKPELEKSLSQDSVLPSRTASDKCETASLKSKESLDSNRSDKSSRSMKKSLFSFLSCVSSTHSPELSPDEEQLNSVVENKAFSPVQSDPKRKVASQDGSQTPRKTLHAPEDSTQSKRNRDRDEQEPTSPSKKSRPEENQKASSSSHASSDSNGKGNGDVSERLLQPNPNEEEEEESNSKHINDDNVHRQKSTSCDKSKNERSSCSRDEENFSMEEKKSRHKRKGKLNLNADSNEGSSDEEFSLFPKSVKKASKDVITVEWNRNVKDLSDTLSSSTASKTQKEQQKNWSWDGTYTDKSTVEALKKAGDLPFGVNVNTWEGVKSQIEQEFSNDRSEAKKRTSDEIYNEELDQGKVSKKRHKNDQVESKFKENPFQRFQNDFINSSQSPSQFSGRGNPFRSSSYSSGPNRSNNSYQYYNKFSNRNSNQNHSWHSHSPSFHPQNHYYRGGPFNHGNKNRNWYPKSEDRRHNKYFGKKREKFRFKNYNH